MAIDNPAGNPRGMQNQGPIELDNGGKIKMQTRVEWHWLIDDLIVGRSWSFTRRTIVNEWFWPPVSGVWHICKAIEYAGLAECIRWAMKGSQIHCVTSCRCVQWEPDDQTRELFLHGWPTHISKMPDYWPWGWSGETPKSEEL